MSPNWNKLVRNTRVLPGRKVNLGKDFDPGSKDGDLDKAGGRAALAEAKSKLFALQDRFYAQADRSLLIVLQAIDAAGKDGTIKHVMSGLNPEGVDVFSYKAPTPVERMHDYLWRHQIQAPELGRIAVFNRSHYENVTITRVHPELLWPKTPELDDDDLWHRRFRQINDWERHLTENGTTIVKLFLNVSKEEQARRFLARIEQPEKNWKFSAEDMHEREYWDAYQHAFNEMLSHTSTKHAPWHVIPADHKWFSRLTTFAVLLETMEAMNPRYPTVSADTKAELAEAKKILEAEIRD
ncbi:polyphosphate kinase 2 family protein [Gordonia rhizosphera]|uniref:Putative polyphosphate kinase n=1 Tax=Gordonia rhizosphera NBRC 16068 TaxID=1108045 RepID=K6WVH0_9ACTN|nr:polyphosphate kinase 2 family protein [Gordonia rhizosphera]GAB90559.1 putative polyphosphate kinase [Gordonia rhizosphera NBRC 16068]